MSRLPEYSTIQQGYPERSSPHIFLGYPDSVSGYLCYNLTNGKIILSRDVIFVENDFSESQRLSDLEDEEVTRLNDEILKLDQDLGLIEQNQFQLQQTKISSNETEESSASQQLNLPAHGMVTRSQTRVRRPNPKYAIQVSAQVVPRNIREAKASPQWTKAMVSEMKALEKNETWSLIPRALEHKVLNCKWVYKLKQDENGNISRHKARLVANGMRQIDDIDVHDTSAPVIKPTTIRVVLSIAITNGWVLR